MLVFHRKPPTLSRNIVNLAIKANSNCFSRDGLQRCALHTNSNSLAFKLLVCDVKRDVNQQAVQTGTSKARHVSYPPL